MVENVKTSGASWRIDTMDDAKSLTFGTRLRAVRRQVAGAMGRLLGEVRSLDPEIKKYRENALVRSRDPEIRRHREGALAKLEGKSLASEGYSVEGHEPTSPSLRSENTKPVRADTSMSPLDSLSPLSTSGASLEGGGIGRDRASPRSEASWAIPFGPSMSSMESLSSIPTSSTSPQLRSRRADGNDRRGSVYTASSSDPDEGAVYRDSHIGAPENQQLPDGKKSRWSHSAVSSVSLRSERSSLHSASLEGSGKTSAELGARAGEIDRRDSVFTAFSQDSDDGSVYRDSHVGALEQQQLPDGKRSRWSHSTVSSVAVQSGRSSLSGASVEGGGKTSAELGARAGGFDRDSVFTAFSQDTDDGSVYRDSHVGAPERQQLPDEMRSRRSASTVSNGLTVRGDRSSLHVTSELDGRSADISEKDQQSRVSSREGDRLDDSIRDARSVTIVRAKPTMIDLKTTHYDERSRARGR